MKRTSQGPLFQVGDWVRIDMGRRKLLGVVREDQGGIGMGGRHLFRVEVPQDPLESKMMVLPEEEMEAVPPGAEKPSHLDKEKVIVYLVSGGLIAILRSNISGGRNQPHVWLCLDSLENVTHTFEAERGVIGGQKVPACAIQDNKVFTAKRDEVESYLESFGLDHNDAKHVVSRVRTAP